MTITKEDCRREGIDEATIARMDANGFFEPTDPIEDRRDDLTADIEEVTGEIEQWESEVAELLESIGSARVRLARLKQRLGELPAPADDE